MSTIVLYKKNKKGYNNYKRVKFLKGKVCMKKNIVKTISIFLLIFIVACLVITSISQAASFDSVDVGFVTQNAKDTSGAGNSIKEIIQSLVVILQVAAMGVAVIMLIVLAIKYMTSAPNDKADIKKSATAYIVGAVVLFAASGILGIIRKFAGNISGATASNP